MHVLRNYKGLVNIYHITIATKHLKLRVSAAASSGQELKECYLQQESYLIEQRLLVKGETKKNKQLEIEAFCCELNREEGHIYLLHQCHQLAIKIRDSSSYCTSQMYRDNI